VAPVLIEAATDSLDGVAANRCGDGRVVLHERQQARLSMVQGSRVDAFVDSPASTSVLPPRLPGLNPARSISASALRVVKGLVERAPRLAAIRGGRRRLRLDPGRPLGRWRPDMPGSIRPPRAAARSSPSRASALCKSAPDAATGPLAARTSTTARPIARPGGRAAGQTAQPCGTSRLTPPLSRLTHGRLRFQRNHADLQAHFELDLRRLAVPSLAPERPANRKRALQCQALTAGGAGAVAAWAKLT
jgi:hypothetical protein